MQKNALTMCCTVCVFGAFGAFCRWLQNMTAYEPNGLYITGNLWGRLLILLAIGAVLGLFGLSQRMTRGCADSGEFEELVGSTTRLHRPISIIIIIVMVAGAGLLVLSAAETIYPTMYRILALLALFAALGFAVMAACARTPTDRAIACFGSALPIFFACFWLILSYREDAVTPVVWRYAPEVLALSASSVGFYYIAGFAFGRPRQAWALFYCGLGTILCISTLPDERPLALQVLFLGMALMQLFFIWAAAANLGRTPANNDEGGEAETDAPEDNSDPAAPDADAPDEPEFILPELPLDED